MMKKIVIACLMLAIIPAKHFGQKTIDFSNFNRNEWIIPDSVEFTTTRYKGKDAVFFKNNYNKKEEEKSIVYLKDFGFTNGTIECDIAADIFTGLCFRVQNNNVAENVYFRPFNSGTAKHEKTVQYVARGTKYTWRYLRKNFPGKYESGTNIKNNEWFHVKLDIEGSTVKIYINNEKEPCLTVTDIKLGVQSGSVGLWSWKGYFANLVITPRN